MKPNRLDDPGCLEVIDAWLHQLARDADYAQRICAAWPTERGAIIKAAVAALGQWAAELGSGVMFYMGQRITRAEFDSASPGALPAPR